MIQGLKNLYTNNFVIYYKSHGFHFNVQGQTFAQDHALLEEIYTFLWEQHDIIGEQIRMQDLTVFPSLRSVLAGASVDEITKPDFNSKAMFGIMAEDLDALITSAQYLYEATEGECAGGLETVIGDYLAGITKLHWKVKATIGASIK